MIIYGKQLFFYALDKRKSSIKTIYLAKECEKSIFSKVVKANKPIIRVDNKKAQALSKGGNHQGFIAEVDDFEFSDFDTVAKENFLVVLYGLTDVGNIGAIIRTAYALGVDSVIIVAKSVSMEGIVRASSGAAFELPICIVSDGLDLMNRLKQLNFNVYSTKADGKNISDVKFAGRKALIMGSEGEGLPKKAFEKSDECIGIPMKRKWDSLNVSVAFGIICDRMANG